MTSPSRAAAKMDCITRALNAHTHTMQYSVGLSGNLQALHEPSAGAGADGQVELACAKRPRLPDDEARVLCEGFRDRLNLLALGSFQAEGQFEGEILPRHGIVDARGDG